MWALLILTALALRSTDAAGVGAARLVCYVENARVIDFNECTHLVYAGNERGDNLENVLKEYRTANPRTKIILRANDDDQDLRKLFKNHQIQGLELHDLHRTLNRSQVLVSVETAKATISSNGGGPLLLSLPSHPELLAKYYDFRTLVKHVDFIVLETHELGVLKKMTYHPSRLSGLWDMMNTDSVVDLVVGLGVPASKLVISLAATARRFILSNESLSTPGSPTIEDQPKEIDQGKLCQLLRKGRWTLERDQDLSAPYAFRNKTWISFEDSSSVDVKGKYARVRGLAGLALRGADDDVKNPCGPTLRTALAKVLNQQSRAPRAAVLRSLEHEILSAGHGRVLDALQVSPYRITQVVDSDGVIHSIREDTRTEFSCSRQGYFVHPRSCARFYRCVKFDQLSPDYTVFEFDCPAGLVFDSSVEVCVWPGSVDSHACPGSSEIAPVPQTRFICPEHEGYYVDPENCRWFFACLDHGKSPLSAYEFRCPFGLGFDPERLKCDWPWLVPSCGNIGRYEAEAFGFSGAALTGAAGFNGLTAEAINIAAHQSLVSGASLDNHVGIQNGFLNKGDLLDANFIASQELANSHLSDDSQLTGPNLAVAINHNIGLVQPTNFESEPKYTSGSLILDDYRYPKNKKQEQANGYYGNNYNVNYQYGAVASSNLKNNLNKDSYYSDDSGAYVHDPTGDLAEPYSHVKGLNVPYIHQDSKYNDGTDEQGYSRYKYQGYNQDDSGKYIAGIYKNNGFIDLNSGGGLYKYSNVQAVPQYSLYGNGKSQDYKPDIKAYTDASHTLAAGAINVGLVGKTKLVDSGFVDQFNYRNAYNGNQNEINLAEHKGHLGLVSAPIVSISHVGTDSHNLDGYANYVTTPTSSGIPTTATPYAVTTAIPVSTASTVSTVTPIISTYKTTFVSEPPKTSIKQIFYSQPESTFVHPTIIPLQQVSPVVTNYNQAIDHQQFELKQTQTVQNINTEQVHKGYDYVKPDIKFEEGVTVTTQTPVTISAYKPTNIENIHNYYLTPAKEEPFKKVIAYTTGAPIEQTLPTVAPSTVSHQTIHYVQSGNEAESVGFVGGYNAYQNVDSPAVSHTYTQNKYHQQNFNFIPKQTGYYYEQPKQYVEHTRIEPEVALQNVDIASEDKIVHSYQNGYNNVVLKQPEYLATQTTVQPQTFSHQIQHIESKDDRNSYSSNNNYNSPTNHKTLVYEQPKILIEQTTSQPIKYSYTTEVNNANNYKSGSYQVDNTNQAHYQPQIYGQQTYHSVDTSQINLNQDAGYEYAKPSIKFKEQIPLVQLTTSKPVESSSQLQDTYSYNIVSTTLAPKVEQPAVTYYENPLLKYRQQAAVTYSQPIVHHELKQNNLFTGQINQQLNGGYSYHQPEIQRNLETTFTGHSYSQASDVSHQYYHLHTGDKTQENKNVVFLSTTPANLAYEEHYAEYENPKKIDTYKAQDFVSSTTQRPSIDITNRGYVYDAPKAQNFVSTTTHRPSIDITNEGYVYDAPKTQDFVSSTTHRPSIDITNGGYVYDAPKTYKSEYAEQYDISRKNLPLQHISFSTSHAVKQPKQVESIHLSPYYGTSVTTTYKPVSYQAPEIQLGNKAEEYLPSISSTESYVTSTYNPVTYSTTSNVNQYRVPTFRPKFVPEIQIGDKFEQYISPIVSTTIKPVVFSTTPSNVKYVTKTPEIKYQEPEFNVHFKANEYLPPIVSTEAPVTSNYNTIYNTVSTEREYLPPVKSSYLPPRTTKRYKVKYTTPTTIRYEEPTTPFQAPEYLPPQDETEYNVDRFELKKLQKSTENLQINPYQEYQNRNAYNIASSSISPVTRKQNIVVQTAKENLLGFETVGPDAGLVSSVSYTTTPITNANSYSTNDLTYSTYKPSKQIIEDVTITPRRRTKPKVAIVTKINDYNPLLVRKLGAVCSCQAPIVVLRGRRPNVKIEDYDIDYNTDYDDDDKDTSEEVIREYKRVRLPVKAKTVTVTTSTFNPIIVPDDSYYQDLSVSKIGDEKYSYLDNYVSSTPIATKERIVTIKPRAKSVTLVPSYKNVILNDVSTAAPLSNEEQVSFTDVKSNGDIRHRSNDILGSTNCQRAGLFRHPKHCNKFYSCRWDDHKQRYTLHVFNCPVQLSFDPTLGACNWPSQGPACQGDTLLSNTL